jgi:hypothetical protein
MGNLLFDLGDKIIFLYFILFLDGCERSRLPVIHVGKISIFVLSFVQRSREGIK